MPISLSGSLLITGSITTTGGITISGSILSASYAATSSFSNDFTVLGNLTVFGTQSVQYITSSQLNVSDNVITVNVASPGVRFGGLSVFDSGSQSSEATASLFWDSQQNHWIYQRESGSTYNGGMLISGPRNAAGLGNESGTTACMLLVGQGGDHLTSSMIYHGTTCTNFYSNTLFVSSSGNVGIGTNNPDRLLQISNTSGQAVFSVIAATNDAADIFLGDNDNKAEAVIRFINGANTFNILQGGSTRMTIASSGSVGIGTNTPSTPLHINCSTTQMVRITSAVSLPSGFADAFQMLFSNQTGGAVSLNIGKAESTNNLGKMAYFHCADGSASNRIAFGFYNNDNLFNVLASGNVGIGTSDPAGKLAVLVGTYQHLIYKAESTYQSSLRFNESNNGARFYTDAGTEEFRMQQQYSSTGFLSYYTGTTERMRITNGGNIYINATTNPVTDNASPQLGILAGASTDAVNIKHTQNGNNTVNIWQTGASQYSAIAFYKGDVQTNRGLIRVDTSGTSYTSVSDYRLKENITELENGLDRVLQLKPSKFNWIETGEEAEGFIAHELQEYFPYAVTGEKDATYSSTGNMKLQSVDYGRITPLLVKAIQEQQCIINTLKTCIGIA
jgi:hypothetical protein